MAYVLGFDGGGSKTLAAVADETGEIHGVGQAGGSNHQGSGLESAMDEIRRAGKQALETAGIEPEQVDAAYYALAGADFPEDFDLLRPALDRLALSRRFELNNDSMAALRTGTDNPDAVVVMLGSGTVAAGRNAAGQEIRLLALGWISGDWGGGGEIAREAIRLVARAWDGRGRPTILEEMILQALDVPDVEALIRNLYHDRVDWKQVLHLAPLVFLAAERGDAVACELVERSGIEVATTATTLLRRLGLLDKPADLVLAGSVFKSESPLLMETIRERVHAIAPRARIVRPNVEPVIGALFLGMDLFGIEVDEHIRDRARRSYETATGTVRTEVMT